MSRSWNGESLVDEFSALLGDTSTAFKSRVLGWINDTIIDISTRHDWDHYKVKGKKLLTAEEEEHSLEIDAPGACEVELAASGSLTASTAYKVLFTFVQDNGVETVAGEESDEISTDASQLTITCTEIPTSNESLITKRRVYVKVGTEPFYYHSEIDDNFTTTLSISTNPDSTIEPPDYDSIRRLKGDPFFEDARSRVVEYRDITQLRRLAQGQWQSGTPEFYSPLSQNSIATYPIPSEEMEVSFYYYRNPFRLYNDEDSQPDLPPYLKPVLKAGVIALGFEYRDRAGQEMKKADYQNALFDAINRGARVANIEFAVRDVYGNYDGFEVS